MGPALVVFAPMAVASDGRSTGEVGIPGRANITASIDLEGILLLDGLTGSAVGSTLASDFGAPVDDLPGQGRVDELLG